MAPISPGGMSGPPRRSQKPTATTKAHRFEPFTKRIGKIKIDPVHTIQKSRLVEEHNDLSKSYFRSSLDEWAELNLTRTFTSFLNKASPLSESLPQLLHHADSIFNLLEEHIQKKEELALEPLLSLVAHLAHDLGQAFEKYFSRTVTLVAQTSTLVEDPAVIECCFTCLAWMFKYLSKVLVQDLRPLLEIMLPYMSAKKDYVRRFTSESLAFLVRKNAIMYRRKPEPLSLALQYLFAQLQSSGKDSELLAYENALMTLLTETAIGIDAQLHSSATELMTCAFDLVDQEQRSDIRLLNILEGTVINLIHRTNAAGFEPLLKLILSHTRKHSDDTKNHSRLYLNLLRAVMVTRKGSRIVDWCTVIETFLEVSQSPTNSMPYEETHLVTLASIAAILQYAPMDQLLPMHKTVLAKAMELCTPTQFFTLCELVAVIGRQRFQDLMLPQLQTYILAHWQNDEMGLCYLLSQLYKKGLVSRTPGQQGYIFPPYEWEGQMTQSLKVSYHDGAFKAVSAPYFQLMEAIHFPKSQDTTQIVNELLALSALNISQHPNDKPDMYSRLSLGWALQAYVKPERMNKSELSTIWQNLAQERQDAYSMNPFLSTCKSVLTVLDAQFVTPSQLEPLIGNMINNMLSEDLILRVDSLQILRRVGELTSNTWLVDTADVLIETANTPYTPSSARHIEMLLRKLPPALAKVDRQSQLFKLIPIFSMSMLRHYHDQTRHVLCTTIREMIVDGYAEDIILDIAMQWLQMPGTIDEPQSLRSKEENTDRLSPFECSNLNLVQSLARRIYEKHSIATDQMKTEFTEAHQLHPPRTPADGRALALHVFQQIPEVVERKSRVLVPVFLSISHGKTNIHNIRSDESISSHTISPGVDEQLWSFRDRKAFLELISKFNNPRVLYRSSELYDNLLECLTNGNTEIRRLSLSALSKWKDASVQRYQDVLLRVAEEKTATTELALLLSDNEDAGSVKPVDRNAVLPLLLRLVFGQLVGRSGNHGSQESKRKSILRLLFRMNSDEIRMFLNIAQGSLGEALSLNKETQFSVGLLEQDLVSADQQYGFLRMVLSMVEILQSQFTPYVKEVMSSVLYCTARASHQIHALPEDYDDDNVTSGTALSRNIQRTGLRCLSLLFEQDPNIQWHPFVHIIMSKLVSPRIATFAVETAQGVSALLRLFSVWAKNGQLLPLLSDYDKRILPTLWDILRVTSAREDVKMFVLEQVLHPLTEQSSRDNIYAARAMEELKIQTDAILESIAFVLANQPSKDLLLTTTRIVPQLENYAIAPAANGKVLELLATLLCEPNQRIPPHIKGSLLIATKSLLRTGIADLSIDVGNKLYEVIAGFYSYFKDQPNRSVLSEILQILNKQNDDVEEAIKICQDLNAQSAKHLEEVDYDRRLAGFTAVNSLTVSHGTMKQWLPLIHNLLYYTKTADDFSVRSNAANCLKRYVSEACGADNNEMQDLIRHTVLPAIKKGTRHDSELVRADFVALFGLIVKSMPNAPELEDMKVLLVGDDEEASFYTNILHIQQHRRLRAIRRLITEVERGRILPINIAECFLPLLDKFVNDESPDESAQGTKGQSIAATSSLLQWIDWKNFRRIFRQYKQDLVSGSRSEKESIKLMHNAADALTSAVEMCSTDANEQPHLAKTLPSIDVVRAELKANFIPKLSEFIHHKDETQISLRIPAAQVTVKLIKLLHSDEVPVLVAPILLDISQILRSRTQESRDTARNTLAGIVELMGPSSIQFVLKELRTTLTRGYQLHVLSYTMHTILLTSSSKYTAGDLDYCLDELVAVVMDDIFGITGQEKENQDYISSMKEVKSSKSFDSMEHLAKSSSVKAMPKLITPFKTLLTGHLTTKQIRHIDELLRRLGVGIAHNDAAGSQELLVFAYELIQAFYKQKAMAPAPVLTHAEKNRARYIVQLESSNKAKGSSSSTLLYKIARFALDLVRSTLLKHPALLTVQNVHGFLPVAGDALVEAQEDVKISAFRLLSAVIKLPIIELDTNAMLYVMEAVKAIRNSINTNEEISQAALKMVTAVLREKQDVQVRDSDIAYLLSRTMPDLEEPDKQGVTFNFIKSVMARKYELPEVYELVDKIGVMMITSQSRNSRDAARGVYVHFLLEYPQSKTRWSKQQKFLVKNLEYQYPEGRQSVMEAMHILLRKTTNGIADELVSTFFVPVILRLANDDHAGCREMAGALLSRLYTKADQAQLRSLLDPLRTWIQQTENTALLKVSLQAWSIFFEVAPPGSETEIALLRPTILQALRSDTDDDGDWQLQFQALDLFQKIVTAFPATVLDSKSNNIWTNVYSLMRVPQAWIQSSAASLIAVLFQDCLSHGSSKVPLISSQGLQVTVDNIINILKTSVKVLKHNEGSSELANRIIQNLLFLGRYVDNNSLNITVKQRADAVTDAGVLIDDDSNAEASSTDEDEEVPMRSITALQYLLDQCVHILRREPSKLTSPAFLPRLTAINLLMNLLPHLAVDSLPTSTTTALLIPLTYITDPNLPIPRSSDPTFPQTFSEYTTSAHGLLEAIQSKLGDSEYVRRMTDVSKIVRQRREGRRQKRVIEKVADPERAAQYKKRKEDRKKDRKKEIKDLYRKKRRGDLGF